jgi:MFS family permease
MMSESQPLNATQRPPPGSPRSIDDVLEHAYSSTTIKNLWRFYIIFFALGLANSGDSAEMGCMGSVMASSQFQHDILQGSLDSEADFAKRGAAIAGAHLAGMLISGLLAGVLADVWGRRKTLLLGLACNSFVGVASAMTRTATQLFILRFVCGLGLGLVISGVVTLSAEIAPPSKRGRFMAIVGSCYTLGYLYISFWAVTIFQSSGSGNWRLFMVANAIPTLLSLSIAYAHVPESPRFYLSRGMLKEAAHATNSIASKLGYVDHYLTEPELRKYLFQAKAIGRTSNLGKESLQQNEDDHQSLPREFLAKLMSLHEVYQDGMYKFTIPLQFAYICLTLVTGVSFWWTKIFQGLNLTIDPFVMTMYHTFSQIPGIVLATYLIDKIGRRSLVATGCAIMSATLCLLSRLAHNNSAERTTSETMIILAFANLNTIGLCLGWLGCKSSLKFGSFYWLACLLHFAQLRSVLSLSSGLPLCRIISN